MAERQRDEPDDEKRKAFFRAYTRLRHRIEELRMRCRARLRERTHGTFPPPGPADRPYWEQGA
jgi:hypothetical protein